MMDIPVFEIVTAAVPGASPGNGRRLATADDVLAALPEEEDVEYSTADINSAIDAACGDMALYANLAVGGNSEPTFAEETLRATWFSRACGQRGTFLHLPWRRDISDIVSVVESGVTLTEGTHFVVFADSCMLLRISGDTPRAWGNGKIIVNWKAGWVCPTNVPDNLRDACVQQVKYKTLLKEVDPNIRSFTAPDIEAASYNIAGGDTISSSGLLRTVEASLEPYRRKVI